MAAGVDSILNSNKQPISVWTKTYLASRPGFKRCSASQIEEITEGLIRETQDLFKNLVEAEGKLSAEEYIVRKGYSIKDEPDHFIDWLPRFAELDDDSKTVLVNSKAEKKVNDLVAAGDLADQIPELKEVILSHELCHILQDESCIPDKKIAKRKWDQLCELQARIFSSVFCDLTFSPRLYEELLVL